MISVNHELDLARDYISETGCNVFLTGKAGTGKTTFLHELKKANPKRMVVTAPTGVAAINAGGVTLHSFFHLPFGPIIPDNLNARGQHRFSKEKINIIKSMDLLVIDEISMVRADLLDGVDGVLRRLRHAATPFGGVQLLMIGDLFQLPPVVKNDEWPLLRQFYSSPYFFSSNALAKTEMVTIELKRVFRQSDREFIDILNKVRINGLDHGSLAKLNARCSAAIPDNDAEGYIILCTHNKNADVINEKKLAEVKGRLYEFHAEVEGQFPEHTYPVAAALALKEGAQVMFTRNDPSDEKQYFNGKIGKIVHISDGVIRIRCPEDVEAIEVEPATWENLEYALNQETLEITEKKIGAFTQYPLRLAWAITIHKSQGLTFDKAIIDAQAAFAHGQVYVALSRCRTLEGMVLSTPLTHNAVKTDATVHQFNATAASNEPGPEHLFEARVRYQRQILLHCFDFKRLQSLLRRFAGLLKTNESIIKVSGVADIAGIEREVSEKIVKVGFNFQHQLNGYFNNRMLPNEDPLILERLGKASVYFGTEIAALLAPLTTGMVIDTDNKELRGSAKKLRQQLEEEIAIKTASVKCCKDGFSSTDYFRAVSAAAIEAGRTKKPTAAAVAYGEADIAHPQLFVRLKEWRSSKASEENLAHFQVMHQKTLIQIAVNLPDSVAALSRIRGIGPKLSEKYGEDIVALVREYLREEGIEEVVLPPVPGRNGGEEKKSSLTTAGTREATLELFQKGLSPGQIADQRKLTLATVEKHLAQLIRAGSLEAEQLITPERLNILADEIEKFADLPLREIRQSLSLEASYGEIQFVLAHLSSAPK